MSRIMGIDYGQRKVGIAISDELHLFAKPYVTITNRSRAELDLQLADIIEKERVTKIVVGIPYHLDGQASKQTEHILRFINHLHNQFQIPVTTYDERYSSEEANEILIKKKVSIKKSKEKIDQIAASIILQSYLNSIEKE